MWNIILIAISLSMDAFSLALSYGMNKISNLEIKKLSFTVGIFHFIMPLLGLLVGNSILYFVSLNTNILVFLILSFIGIEMIVESFKKKEVVEVVSFFELILFAVAVSLDSFSVGIGFQTLTNNPVISSIIFAFTSSIFTCVGLKLGVYVNNKIGVLSTLAGGICLVILGLLYIL